MKTYTINGKEIQFFDGGGVVQQLLEALDEKKEGCNHDLNKSCKNCAVWTDVSKPECKHNWIGLSSNDYMECTKCNKKTEEPKSECKHDKIYIIHKINGDTTEECRICNRVLGGTKAQPKFNLNTEQEEEWCNACRWEGIEQTRYNFLHTCRLEPKSTLREEHGHFQSKSLSKQPTPLREEINSIFYDYTGSDFEGTPAEKITSLFKDTLLEDYQELTWYQNNEGVKELEENTWYLKNEDIIKLIKNL